MEEEVAMEEEWVVEEAEVAMEEEWAVEEAEVVEAETTMEAIAAVGEGLYACY